MPVQLTYADVAAVLSGVPIAEIARRYGVSRQYISLLLKRMGVTVDKPMPRQITGPLPLTRRVMERLKNMQVPVEWKPEMGHRSFVANGWSCAVTYASRARRLHPSAKRSYYRIRFPAKNRDLIIAVLGSPEHQQTTLVIPLEWIQQRQKDRQWFYVPENLEGTEWEQWSEAWWQIELPRELFMHEDKPEQE